MVNCVQFAAQERRLRISRGRLLFRKKRIAHGVHMYIENYNKLDTYYYAFICQASNLYVEVSFKRGLHEKFRTNFALLINRFPKAQICNDLIKDL